MGRKIPVPLLRGLKPSSSYGCANSEAKPDTVTPTTDLYLALCGGWQAAPRIGLRRLLHVFQSKALINLFALPFVASEYVFSFLSLCFTQMTKNMFCHLLPLTIILIQRQLFRGTSARSTAACLSRNDAPVTLDNTQTLMLTVFTWNYFLLYKTK